MEPVADQGPGNGHHLPGLIRGQAEQGCDAIGIGEHLHHAASRGNFHRGTHPQRHLIHQGHLIHDGDLSIQPVVDQHAVIPLHDGRGDLAAAGAAPVDQSGRLLKIHGLGNDRNIVLSPRGLLQVGDQDGLSHTHAHTARCGGIVADHGGLGDDGLGNGLHCHIADDGGGLVEPHLRQILNGIAGLLQSVVQGVENTIDVLAGALDARGGHRTAGQEHSAAILQTGQRRFRGRVSNVDACDKFHGAPPDSGK